jgi:hypothetical protein
MLVSSAPFLWTIFLKLRLESLISDLLLGRERVWISEDICRLLMKLEVKLYTLTHWYISFNSDNIDIRHAISKHASLISLSFKSNNQPLIKFQTPLLQVSHCSNFKEGESRCYVLILLLALQIPF